MEIYYNPLDPACKSVTGGIPEGKEVEFHLFLLNEESEGKGGKNAAGLIKAPLPEECVAPEEDAVFLIGRDGEEKSGYAMQRTSYGWRISLKIHRIGLYFYAFSVKNAFIVCGKGRNGRFSESEEPDYQMTVFSKDYRTPDWFKGGILYQIFPDRFCKAGSMPDIKGRIAREDWGGIPSFLPNEKGKILNNDFFGGNFKGIQSKLPYLKDLNVTCIYLNPIFEAASNHRYDTSDYLQTDPFLGTKEEFAELVNEARKYGIRIVLDGVFNHTGDDSVYFNKYGTYPSVGAYQSKDSPYYSWYTFQSFPDRYSCWWGIDILPEVNERSEDYQEFIFGESGVLKTWLSYGIGGYRLDVADELPDFFLKKLRKSVKEANPDALIIGEVWEDASDKIAYSVRREYLQGNELDSVMNYPLKDAIIHFVLTGRADELSEVIRTLTDHYPKQTLDCLMNILGTHDTARILTVFGQKACYTKEEMAKPEMLLTETEKIAATEKVKMAALLQYTFPGVPCVYYGDENGAEGYIDPFCRRCFDWEHINEDLLTYYRKLGKIRSEFHEIFKDGIFEEIFVFCGFYMFRRSNKRGSVYIYVNNTSEEYTVGFKGSYREYLSDRDFENALTVKPYSYGIFSENRKSVR